MALDGLGADDEQLGDLLRAVGLCDQLHDLGLAGCENLATLAGRALEVVANEGADRGRVEEGLVAHGRSARIDQVAVGAGLEDVAGRAGAQCLEQVLGAVVHREHQDPHVGPRADDLAGSGDPGHPWHGDVEDREVDVVLERGPDRLDTVAGLRDDGEVRLGVDQEPEAVAHDVVVVGQQHAGRRGVAHRSGGAVSTTSTPPSAWFSIVSVAPISSARSRMPRIP